MRSINLKLNLDRIEENIQKSLLRAGRENEKVDLIAVTKTVDTNIIEKSISLGVTDIGENRVQELEKKIDLIGNKVNYHMIGHLQTNKVKYIIDKVKLIHSLDRISLARELNKRAAMNNLKIDCLIQVNVSMEETKFGLGVEELIPFIEELLNFNNINIKGLMTIAPHTQDEKNLRKIFRKMLELREKVKNNNYKELTMEYLSMGMTNDYEIAIEEGSNMVRIGSGIFGARNY